MSLWGWLTNPGRDRQANAYKQAQKAVQMAQIAQEVSQRQQEALDELIPPLERKIGVLARINRENNFARRLEAAYRGGN